MAAYEDDPDDYGIPPSPSTAPATPEEQHDIQALLRQLINERGGDTGLDASTYRTLIAELTTAYQRQRSSGADHTTALSYVRGTLPATYLDPVTPPPVAAGDGGGGGGGRGMGGPAIDPSYLVPWTESFKPPAGSALPTYQAPDPFTYQDFQAPAEFEPLTAQDILKDPSYLWREGRVRDQIENSAAARGLLGSSGTLYDIGSAAGNFASQEYGLANDRAWDQWRGKYDAALTGYQTNRNNAVDTYATNYGVNKDTYGLLRDRSEDVYNRAWNVFDDRRKTFYSNQSRPLEALFRGADIGARAAMY